MGRDATVKAIEAALEQDPAINLHSHPVHIEHGDGVRLHGTVADIRAKRRALQQARAAAGTASVDDELRVERAEARGERELRQAVVATLMQEPAFAESRVVDGDAVAAADAGDVIAVAADGARVRLDGHVTSVARRRLAEALAWWVPGVADVVNRLQAAPGEPDGDGELADAIRLVLEKDPSIPARQLEITARAGVIRLAGAVDSEEQRRLALLDCWYVPGVEGVEDELAVKTP
ncbi:MAG: BON domain-containing protein [Halofilum sp. (in: g-proteobacteria)]|nr:BON domain-containing protein [Halofilum sp. (in: g-proteobacteria)]